MNFWKAVGVLVSGTALGHAITAISLPVITRIYSPSEYGEFATFTAIVAVASVAACLRYEIAISLPEEVSEARSLFLLSMILALASGGACYLVALMVGHIWFDSSVGIFLSKYKLHVAIAIGITGGLAALQNWSVRVRNFRGIAHSKILQSAITSTSQMVVGWTHLGSSIGLVVGYIAGFAASALFLFVANARNLGYKPIHLGRVSPLWKVARKHSTFPKFSTPEAIVNSASNQVPLLLIVASGGSAEAGYILLAMSVLHAPMALIGSAIGQVFLSTASEAHRAAQLDLLVSQTTRRLAFAGVLPLMAIAIASPFLVPIVFGSEWERTGELMLWMGPWFVMQFLVSPLSMVLQVTGKQKLAFKLQLSGFIGRVGSVPVAIFFDLGLGEALATSSFIFYVAYFVVILRSAEVRFGQSAV